ncbi:hypothetical protein V6Z12_D08G302100 [Gossypium hirsutum]
MEEKMGGSNGEDSGEDQFPVGMRVLAVDDDPICLKILANLLCKCQYQVTTTNQAIIALKMLRENKNRYDLVISDVNMPDMDGFKLLELVGLEMDLPVIMLSAHSDTKLVMKGITHGACDYLLKPVRIEELKNIWQHVVRRKKPDSKDELAAPNHDKARGGTGEAGQTWVACSSDQKVNKKRKDQSEDEEEETEDNGRENEDSSCQKKPRVVWSVDLHRKLLQLSINWVLAAVPKKILDLMNVEGLTRENVASHLQKYRLYLRRLSSVATQQANMVVALGSRGPSHLRTGSLDGFGDFRSFTGPGRFSSASLPSYQSRGTFGRLNSSAALTLSGISSGVIQPGNSVNGLRKIQPVVLPANQNQNGALFQGITASIELNQLSQTKSTNHFGKYNCVDERNVFRISSSFPDARVVVGSSSNSLSTASGNALVLQGTRNSVRGSSNCLEHGRCSENWQGTVQLSNFPPSNEQLPSNNLQESIPWRNSSPSNSRIALSSMASSAVLGDSRADILCKAGLNNSYSHVDSRVSASGSMMDQNNAVSSNTNDVSLFSHLNGEAPLLLGTLRATNHRLTDLRSNDNFLFLQSKPQKRFSQNNFESLEDINESRFQTGAK